MPKNDPYEHWENQCLEADEEAKKPEPKRECSREGGCGGNCKCDQPPPGLTPELIIRMSVQGLEQKVEALGLQEMYLNELMLSALATVAAWTCQLPEGERQAMFHKGIKALVEMLEMNAVEIGKKVATYGTREDA